MIVPEQNDVGISQLFKWGKKMSIYDASNQVMFSCYIRLVGDAEMNRARVFALRKSAEFRKKLRTPDSDERVAYIAEKEFITKEELVKYVLLLKNKTLQERAYKEIKIPFPKELDSEADLEAQEKYQKLVDDYPHKVQEAVKKYVEKELKTEEADLTKKSMDELYPTYENLVTNDFCELEMLNAFRDYCVASGSFSDPEYTDRLFANVDEYKQLPSDIKQQFDAEYNSLEIDVNTLKKLPAVMPS